MKIGVIIAFFHDDGILLTDMNELNIRESGYDMDDTKCLINIGENPSGSQVVLGFKCFLLADLSIAVK